MKLTLTCIVALLIITFCNGQVMKFKAFKAVSIYINPEETKPFKNNALIILDIDLSEIRFKLSDDASWFVMTDLSRLNNYVDEDGDSWLTYTCIDKEGDKRTVKILYEKEQYIVLFTNKGKSTAYYCNPYK